MKSPKNPKHNLNKTENISIAYQNVRGMKSKLKSFFIKSFEINHHIVVLTETWLRNKIQNHINISARVR